MIITRNTQTQYWCALRTSLSRLLHLISSSVQHVHQNTYRLHAIVLSRSPYLAHLMSTSPKSGGMHTIYVPLEGVPEITDQVRLLTGKIKSEH